MHEPENFCFQNYGTKIRLDEVQAIVNTGLSFGSRKAPRPTPLNIGIINPVTAKTQVLSCSWGMTGPEIRLASSAAYFLSTFRLPLFYAVVSDKDVPEREAREAIRLFKTELAKEQGREYRRGELPMAPAYLEVLEGWTGVHSNILFPLRASRAVRWIPSMMLSPRFSVSSNGRRLDIQRAAGWRWFVSYCSEERTPQAKYVGGVGALSPRKKGPHRLGDGGGDRVRLSEPVEETLIDRGEACPRRRAYAKGLPKRELERKPQVEERVYLFDLEGQGNLFDALSASPAPERPRIVPRHRDKIAPVPMLRLFSVVGNVDILETMRGLGPTHEVIAERLGISRPQATNILNGQFRPGRQVVRRVLELSKAA